MTWKRLFLLDWWLLGLLMVLLACLTLRFNWILAGILLYFVFKLFQTSRLQIGLFLTCLLLLTGSLAFRQFPAQRDSLLEGDESRLIWIDPIQARVQEGAWSGHGYLFLKEGGRIPIAYYARLGPEDSFLSDRPAYYRVQGQLTVPECRRNFGVFDYRNYLKGYGIDYQIYIEDLVACQEDQSLRGHLGRLRLWLLTPIYEHINSPWMAFFAKIYFNIDSEVYRDYRPWIQDFGVAHLFAISGFHISFLIQAVRGGLLRIGLGQRTSFYCLILVLFAYLWLIRFPVGALRASLVFILRTCLSQRDRSMDPLNILGLSAVILLGVNPLWADSLAFQLSFMMTALLYLASAHGRLDDGFISSLQVTGLCSLFAFPLVVNLNFSFSLGQVFLAGILTWLFSKYLLQAWAASLLLVFLPVFISGPVIKLLDSLLILVMELLIRLWQGLALDFTLGYQSNFCRLGFFILALLYAYGYFYQSKVYQYASLGLLLVSIFLLSQFQWSHRITFLDIGQGDAMIYQPKGLKKAYLVDTGGRLSFSASGPGLDEDFARRTLIPALRALGVGRLDAVVITHHDIDHSGNLWTLGQDMDIGYILVNEMTAGDPDFIDRYQAQLSHVPLQLIRQGDQVYLHDHLLALTLLDPYLPNSSDIKNDSSIVVYIHRPGFNLLNLGDLGQTREEMLIHQLPLPSLTFLKLAHHGSRHSTSELMLAAYQPTLALISAGKDNRYGHPHPECLHRLKVVGIPYLGTYQGGAIQIREDMFGHISVDQVQK